MLLIGLSLAALCVAIWLAVLLGVGAVALCCGWVTAWVALGALLTGPCAVIVWGLVTGVEHAPFYAEKSRKRKTPP
jgi:uncharacterized membrane protein